MLTTALALFLAHLLADYPLQNSWIIKNKKQPLAMACHIAVVFLLTFLALRGNLLPALIITGAHLIIDLIKTHYGPDKLWAYLTDQAAHVATIVLVLLARPDLSTLWPEATAYVNYVLVLACGLILSVWAGGPAIGYLMEKFEDARGDSLPEAGRTIGMLERALVFLMVISGQPGSIGFLIAAKSIFRFDTTADNRKVAEYVIIGTLASFGWALLVSYGALSLITIAGIDPTPS